MIVLMELRNGDLNSAAGLKVQALSDYKGTDKKPGRQKGLVLARIWSLYESLGIRFEFRPQKLFDRVLNCIVENNLPA
jgi:hypothetical protein